MLATSSEANNTPSVSAISSISENSEPIGMYFLAASRWFFLARLPCTLPRSSLMSIIASFLARFSLTSVPSPVLPSARFSSLNCASEAALISCCLFIFLRDEAPPDSSFAYSLMWSSKCLTLVGDKFSRTQPSASLVLSPPCPLKKAASSGMSKVGSGPSADFSNTFILAFRYVDFWRTTSFAMARIASSGTTLPKYDFAAFSCGVSLPFLPSFA